MKNLIYFIRLIAFFIFLVGVVFELQGSQSGDDIIKFALFLVFCSMVCWGVWRLKRGKGAY